MNKDRTSLLEDFVTLGSRFPWWISLTAAVASLFFLHAEALQPPLHLPAGPDPLHRALLQGIFPTFCFLGQYIIPPLLLTVSITSAIRSLKEHGEE